MLSHRPRSPRPSSRHPSSPRRDLGTSGPAWIAPLALVAIFLTGPLASRAADLSGLSLVPVADDLAQPIAITHAGDERLFLALKDGRIIIVEHGAVRDEPFLDIRGRVDSAGGEKGLLSVAFHPAYATTASFFVNYTGAGGATVISRFTVTTDPNVADPSTETVLLTFPQPFSNHNGGQLQFGPDGKLYVASGDGGSGNDPMCNAQDGDTLLGKLLRLEVDGSVPADNPFVGDPAQPDEVWALGLRNPWRFSFDRATGDLFIGDVGQFSREEIDRMPAGVGGLNFGWKVMEGTLCLGGTGGCASPPPGCASPAYTPPILEYDHSAGNCAVIGGYVYRGADIPSLVGAYLYGDFCSGTLWAAERDGDTWTAQQLTATLPGLSAWGEDQDGELYLVDGDTLYRLVDPLAPCVADATTLCLGGSRFQATLTFRDDQGEPGTGQAEVLTPDAGFFWFFSPDNPEVFVKVIDACAEPFLHYWVFAAGLTDLETELVVVDTTTGAEQRYTKDPATGFPPIRDFIAFDCP